MPEQERSNAVVFLDTEVERGVFGALKSTAERFLSWENIPDGMTEAKRLEYAQEILVRMQGAAVNYFACAMSKLDKSGAPQFVNEMRGMKTPDK
jgi:hypothetical protein